jgi:hypothetical protein
MRLGYWIMRQIVFTTTGMILANGTETLATVMKLEKGICVLVYFFASKDKPSEMYFKDGNYPNFPSNWNSHFHDWFTDLVRNHKTEIHL